MMDNAGLDFTDLSVTDGKGETVPDFRARYSTPVDDDLPPRRVSRGKATPAFKLPTETISFEKPLMALYAAIGMGVSPALPMTGQVIVMNAEKCAKAWDELAKENESVRKALEALTSVSTVGAVIIVHAPIIRCAMDEIKAKQEAAKLRKLEEEYEAASNKGPEYTRG